MLDVLDSFVIIFKNIYFASLLASLWEESILFGFHPIILYTVYLCKCVLTSSYSRPLMF